MVHAYWAGSGDNVRPSPLIAVSLKMYFDLPRALAYFQSMQEFVVDVPAVADKRVRVAVFPDFLALPAACSQLAEGAILVGAQDLCPVDRGAFTGEVSGIDLASLGAAVVVVGHAERRRLFAEDDVLVAAKCAAAIRNGLIPLICIGEPEYVGAEAAARECIAQARGALVNVASDAEVWIAYEPHWAIGKRDPAPAGHVSEVCAVVRDDLARTWPRLTLVYGGSAGPGLLERLGGSVDGLFMGRFAHDPASLRRVVDEAVDMLEARQG